jgi:hypothetical protein
VSAAETAWKIAQKQAQGQQAVAISQAKADALTRWAAAHASPANMRAAAIAVAEAARDAASFALSPAVWAAEQAAESDWVSTMLGAWQTMGSSLETPTSTLRSAVIRAAETLKNTAATSEIQIQLVTLPAGQQQRDQIVDAQVDWIDGVTEAEWQLADAMAANRNAALFARSAMLYDLIGDAIRAESDFQTAQNQAQQMYWYEVANAIQNAPPSQRQLIVDLAEGGFPTLIPAAPSVGPSHEVLQFMNAFQGLAQAAYWAGCCENRCFALRDFCEGKLRARFGNTLQFEAYGAVLWWMPLSDIVPHGTIPFTGNINDGGFLVTDPESGLIWYIHVTPWGLGFLPPTASVDLFRDDFFWTQP